MELILVRHAQPLRIELAEGPADPPLSPLGRMQAAAVADWLKHESIDAIYASPLRRAVETAEPIARLLGLEVVIEPGVSEFDADSPSYVPLEELKAADHPVWKAFVEDRWHELVGLDPVEFKNNACDSIEKLIDTNPGGRVVVVAHGGIINFFTARVLGLPRDLWFEPDYTSISRVMASRSGIRTIRSLNETQHLKGVKDTHDAG